MADSLVHAIEYAKVPCELIVVDKLLWEAAPQRLIRREELAEALKGRISYRHVPPKPSPWQGPWRKTKRDFYDLNNARNSVIALARGTYVVLFDDCSVIHARWLAVHAAAARTGVAVAGSFRTYNEATVVNGRIVDGTLHPSGVDHRGEISVECGGGWLYGLNCSFPLEAAIKVNGYDEKFSSQGGSEDTHFGIRIVMAGYKVVYFPQCLIYQVLATHEPVCEIETWGKPQVVKQKELMLKDGKMHFKNEYLIQEWAEHPYIQSKGNDFDIRELRKNALMYGEFPTKRTVEVDWADNQPLSDME
jgi:hypothetical protein